MSRYWRIEQDSGYEYVEADHVEVQQGALLRFYSTTERGAYQTIAMFHPVHWYCFKEVSEDDYVEHAEDV